MQLVRAGAFLSTSGKIKNILVVDDDEDIRDILVDFLRTEGHHVTPAANGQQALREMRSSPQPDLVFLDMMMPIMDGRSFLDEITSHPATSSIPIVVLSASASPREAVGATAFIKKPVDLPQILECVERYSHP